MKIKTIRIVAYTVIITLIILNFIAYLNDVTPKNKNPTLNVEYVLDTENPFSKKIIVVPICISNDYVQYKHKNSNHINSDSIITFNICYKKND